MRMKGRSDGRGIKGKRGVMWAYCGVKGAGLANEFIEVFGRIRKVRARQAGWRAKGKELLPLISGSKWDNLLKNNQLLTGLNLEIGPERGIWFSSGLR